MDLPFGLGTFPLPAWMPAWVPVLLLVPIALYCLLALLVPFNVFGVKSRLETIEVRLDEVEQQLRSMVLRLPAPIGEELPPVRGREATRGYRADPELLPPARDTRTRSGRRAEGRPVGVRAEPRIEPDNWAE